MKVIDWCGFVSVRISLLVSLTSFSIITSQVAHSTPTLLTCGTGKVVWVRSNMNNNGELGFGLQVDGLPLPQQHHSAVSINSSAAARVIHDKILLAAVTGATVTAVTTGSSCLHDSFIDDTWWATGFYDITFYTP